MSKRYLEIGAGPDRIFGYDSSALESNDIITQVDPIKDLGTIGVQASLEFLINPKKDEWAGRIYPTAKCAGSALEVIGGADILTEFAYVADQQKRRNEQREAAARSSGVKIHSVFANGRSLPFGNDVFDEVLLQNVIGDQNVGKCIEDILELVKETLRVAKDANVVFLETYTPDVAGDRLSEVAGIMGESLSLIEIHYTVGTNGKVVGLEPRYMPAKPRRSIGVSIFKIL